MNEFEIKILSGLSDGKSFLQIAKEIDSLGSIISKHILNLRRKSKSRNVAQLVGWAFRNKYIE